jgi:hypothetical protein
VTRVLHAFADYAVESEALATIGTVTRWTRDPQPNPHVDETVTVDLMENVPSGQFDIALLHPRCTDESEMTSISGDPDDHENQIPRAREIATQVAEDYVIENKPRDDLQDPTELHGRMFGLPLAYERAFETSFPVRHPARHQPLGEKTVTPYFYSDRTREWWAATKGYRGDYPKEHLAKNALPPAYVSCLVRSWLESLDTRDTEVPKDNNNPPPPKISDEQATLLQTNGGRDGRSVDTETESYGGG